ncbi:hypothetical protein GCM10023317_40520 [Actinopolymorpha pittospori]
MYWHPGYRHRMSRSSKDTRRWCRSKDGLEHVPMVTMPSAGSVRCHSHSWWNLDEPVWSCWHVSICKRCGKRLSKEVRCPDLPQGMKQLGIDWPDLHGGE